jgi:hypothetical protein
MSKNSQSSAAGGIGFAGLLAILFIALKLTGVITWSWVWVLAPLWIPLAIVLPIIAVILVLALIAAALGNK